MDLPPRRYAQEEHEGHEDNSLPNAMSGTSGSLWRQNHPFGHRVDGVLGPLSASSSGRWVRTRRVPFSAAAVDHLAGVVAGGLRILRCYDTGEPFQIPIWNAKFSRRLSDVAQIGGS